MNAFDGLLPPPTTAPPLPHRGGAAAAVAAARTRRRTRAVKAAGTGTVLSMAFGAILFMRPAPGVNRIGVDPDATASPSATARLHSPSVTPAPTREPRRGVSAPPTLTPAPPGGSGAVTVPSVGVSVPPPPSTSPSPTPRGVRYTSIDRSVVADTPTETCDAHAAPSDPTAGLCSRYTGPLSAKVGQPIDLTYLFCARVGDVTVDFASRQEVRFTLIGDVSKRLIWTGVSPPGGSPHSVTVENGTCLQYVAHWDGRTSEGAKPVPARYEIGALLLDDQQDSSPASRPHVIDLHE